MKGQVRVLAVDDAPFRFDAAQAMVVGVVVRLPSYLEGVLRTECQVDGEDATDVLEEMIRGSRFRKSLKAVLLDGVALGGFNLVDIRSLYEKVGLPVITVTRDHPDLGRMESALRKHFPDWEKRLELLRRQELFEVDTGHAPILVSAVGMERAEVEELISKSVVRGAIPEALRMAHIIASGLARGESKGKA